VDCGPSTHLKTPHRKNFCWRLRIGSWLTDEPIIKSALSNQQKLLTGDCGLGLLPD
jgi:hypothetical protein